MDYIRGPVHHCHIHRHAPGDWQPSDEVQGKVQPRLLGHRQRTVNARSAAGSIDLSTGLTGGKELPNVSGRFQRPKSLADN